MTIVRRISQPSLNIKLLKLLQNQRVILELSVPLPVNADCRNKFIIADWNIFVAVDAGKDELVDVHGEGHGFV